jgi:hypothetical protein
VFITSKSKLNGSPLLYISRAHGSILSVKAGSPERFFIFPQLLQSNVWTLHILPDSLFAFILHLMIKYEKMSLNNLRSGQ